MVVLFKKMVSLYFEAEKKTGKMFKHWKITGKHGHFYLGVATVISDIEKEFDSHN